MGILILSGVANYDHSPNYLPALQECVDPQGAQPRGVPQVQKGPLDRTNTTRAEAGVTTVYKLKIRALPTLLLVALVAAVSGGIAGYFGANFGHAHGEPTYSSQPAGPSYNPYQDWDLGRRMSDQTEYLRQQSQDDLSDLERRMSNQMEYLDRQDWWP